MANILILSLVFSPDGVSTAVIVSELANDLKSRGHTITVLTTHPHYNVDEEARANQPLKRRWRGMFFQSEYSGIPVWHTKMRPKGERTLGRIIDYLVFHIISIGLAIRAIGHPEIVIAVSPPLSIGIVGWIIALFHKAKLIYNVQELYPDAAVAIGILKEKALVTRILRWFERFIYNRSHALAVICEPFAELIVNKHIVRDKIHVIPNFVDTSFIQPTPKDNSLARELGIQGKFVILYAGNIGFTQSFDTLLEVAKRLQERTEIAFLIVGDGARKSQLEGKVSEQNLVMVTLLPYQPRSRVPEIYGMADLCIVPLMAGTARTTVPSKLYTIMASGRPALVAVDQDSALVQTVTISRCGIVVAPDDADALQHGIIKAFDNQTKFREFGQNGRQYVEQHLSRTAISERYHKLIQQLADCNN